MLESNYEYKRPQIIYDMALRGYVCTGQSIQREYFDIENLVEALCCDNFVFEYKINGEWMHGHEIRCVMQEAYKYGKQFEIPEEVENQYSEQELRVLRKLADIGQKHIDNYMAFLKENHVYDSEFEDECY